jgi:cytoskeletal protein CcmA (bactofilin family)
VIWKRGDEARSGMAKPQPEWTTGELLRKAPEATPVATPRATAVTTPGAPSVVVRVPVLRPALGPDTSVSGRLSFTMPTRIDGKLRGEVHATDVLLIGEQGYVEGVVRAPTLIVLGEVRGDVRGAERVEIGPGGRVMGSVETTSLVVEEGGYLDGDCRIAPSRATVHVLRPVQASG